MNRIPLILVVVLALAAAAYFFTQQDAEVTQEDAGLQPEVAFECPAEAQEMADMAISESPDEVKAVTDLLAADSSENNIRVVVTQLQQEYPTAGAAEIADFLAMAHCPTIAAETGLSDSEKRQKLTDFTAQAFDIVGQQ